MKTLKSLAIVFCVSLFLVSPRMRADEWNKETKITFSGPVQVANTQLEAGTYVFKLADTADRHVVQIFNEDQTQVIATILAIPDYRVTPTDHTLIKFAETSDGSEASGTLPDSGIPIKEWFYPGDNSGQEFRVVPQQVAALQPEPEPAAAPEPQPETPQAAAPAPAEPAAPEAQAPPAAPEVPAETPQAAPTESTPEQPAAPEQLPQTASQIPLLGLIGFLSLAAAASFRFVLKRGA